MLGGRPSRTPWARLRASASLVRREISSRSQGANVASRFALASPLGGVGSSAQARAISAKPCSCALASRLASSSSGLLAQFAQLPAAAPAGCRERPSLRLEAGTALALPLAPQPTNPSTCRGVSSLLRRDPAQMYSNNYLLYSDEGSASRRTKPVATRDFLQRSRVSCGGF